MSRLRTRGSQRRGGSLPGGATRPKIQLRPLRRSSCQPVVSRCFFLPSRGVRKKAPATSAPATKGNQRTSRKPAKPYSLTRVLATCAQIVSNRLKNSSHRLTSKQTATVALEELESVESRERGETARTGKPTRILHLDSFLRRTPIVQRLPVPDVREYSALRDTHQP